MSRCNASLTAARRGRDTADAGRGRPTISRLAVLLLATLVAATGAVAAAVLSDRGIDELDVDALSVDDTGWRIWVLGAAGGKTPRPLGKGALRLDGGSPLLDFESSDGRIRVAEEESGRYLAAAVETGPRRWVDLTDPLGASAVGFVSRPLHGPARRVRSEHDAAGRPLSVFVRSGPGDASPDTVSAELQEVWVDAKGQPRRLVTRTTIRRRHGDPADVLRLYLVADRDDAVQAYGSHGHGDDIVPGAAEARAASPMPPAQSAGTRSSGSRLASLTLNAQYGAALVQGRRGDCEILVDRRGDFVRRCGGGRPVKIDPAGELDELWLGPPGQSPEEPEELPREDSRSAAPHPQRVEQIEDAAVSIAGCVWATASAIGSARRLGGVVAVGKSVGSAVGVFEKCHDAGRRWGRIVGDPHVTTLDGHRYALQSTGEFVYLNGASLAVQSRFEGSKGTWTGATATAVRSGTHVIEFYLADAHDSSSVSAVIDGREVDVGFTGLALPDGTFVARRSGRNDDRNLIVVDRQGSYVLIENHTSNQNVLLGLTGADSAHVTGGLAGIPDGDRTNDFTLRDGTVVGFAEARTVDGLYGRFAGSWRVRPSERLFTRGAASEFLTREHTSVPETVFGLGDFPPDAVTSARERCRRAGVRSGAATEDCAYDLLASRDDRWVADAARSRSSGGTGAPAGGGTDTATRGRTRADHPLLVAADDCDLATVDRLLTQGANPSLRRAEDDYTALMFAGQSDCPAVVRRLLRAGADPDDRGQEGVSALYLAAQDGAVGTLTELLRGGADPRVALDDGDTPLLVASYRGHRSTVRKLLAAGAFVDVARAEDGFTPLLASAQENEHAVASVLLRSGADPNRTGSDGRTALAASAYRGHTEVVRILLRAGADPDRRRISDGATALHFAAQEGHRPVVEALIAAGADPTLRHDDGRTASDFADPAVRDLLPRAR